jgi:hypothetical protein
LSAKDESGKFICPHAPGTHKGMELDHQESQVARGVKGGKASYTLVDAIPQEVSAVFKGAVPGAGFRKALALSRSGALGAVELSEARESYAGLLDRDDKTFSPTRRATSIFFGADMDILKAFKFWQAAGEPEEINFEALASNPEKTTTQGKFTVLDTTATAEDPEKLALKAEVEKLRKEGESIRLDGFRREAEKFADRQVAEGRMLPAEREECIRLHVQLATWDLQEPYESGTRLAFFERLHDQRQLHGLSEEKITPLMPEGAYVLPNSPEAPDAAKAKAERFANLMSHTPLGKAVAVNGKA